MNIPLDLFVSIRKSDRFISILISSLTDGTTVMDAKDVCLFPY